MKHLTQDQLRCLTVIAFLRGRWVKGYYALRRLGGECRVASEEAHHFCWVGAWEHLYGVKPNRAVELHRLNDRARDFEELAADMRKVYVL